MELSGLFWAAAKAFLISLILTPIVRDIFRSYNVVDRPGRRKVHAYPIPRVGGIPIAAAYLISILSVSSNSASGAAFPAWQLLPGAGLIFLTGILDDFFNLRPFYKLGGQIAAAALVFSNGVRIETIGDVTLPLAVSLPLSIFWLLLTTNAFNLIDGLDGLCAGIGFLAVGTLFAAGWIQGNAALQYATVPLAGALLAFLCYNFNPATMFLGDSGALLIGFLLGCYGMIWTQKTATAVGFTVPLLVLSIPLFDVSLSVLRRFLKNRPIFSPDRGHIHHRLLDRGLTPRRAVLTLYLAAALVAVYALLLSHPSLRRWQGVVIIGFCATAWVGVRELRYPEFQVAARLLFRGEFQRALESKARLQHLAEALQQCRTEEDWWRVLANAAREAGWLRVEFIHEEAARRQASFGSDAPAWSFRLALGEGEYLQIDGPAQSATPPLDLVGFAGAVQSSFAGLQRVREQPALS